jgi:hypothetical protein
VPATCCSLSDKNFLLMKKRNYEEMTDPSFFNSTESSNSHSSLPCQNNFDSAMTTTTSMDRRIQASNQSEIEDESTTNPSEHEIEDRHHFPHTVSNELHAWVDIFATSKLVLSMNPRNITNPHVMIQHAQKEFLMNFGFTPELLPFPLHYIYGNSTERNKIIRLEQSLLTSRSFSEFINLHKSNGSSLSCHASLLALTNQNDTTSVVPQMMMMDMNYQSNQFLKYGVLTIRSASVVGNSKYSGIGLMGTERVSRDRIEITASSSTTTTTATTSSRSHQNNHHNSHMKG